jgi:hypothetical protein
MILVKKKSISIGSHRPDRFVLSTPSPAFSPRRRYSAGVCETESFFRWWNIRGDSFAPAVWSAVPLFSAPGRPSGTPTLFFRENPNTAVYRTCILTFYSLASIIAAMALRDEVLVIHPGGLGDVCLSESTFVSLSQHFGACLRVVGSRRVLLQFSEYFSRIDSIDSRTWTPLFSDFGDELRWETAILIGKDRSGALRQRLHRFARAFSFIEMYPDQERVHVEDYQLEQLSRWGVKPLRKRRETRVGDRLILYAEEAYRKKKWPAHRFIELRRVLREAGVLAVLGGPKGLHAPALDLIMPDDLADVAALFATGGLFFSNDSGMAHFAAKCGLHTLTLFADTDPAVWHPINGTVLASGKELPAVSEVLQFILSASKQVGFPDRPPEPASGA